MKRIIIMTVVLAFSLTNIAFAFDAQLAARFDGMFSQFTAEMIAKRPCEVNAKQLFDMIKAKEPFIILDIRTPQEMEIVGVSYKDSLKIPMNELFRQDNLKKLPKDRKIIVLCHTGTRAVAAAMALRAIGFENAVMFKGGIAELASESGRRVVGLLW